MKVSLRAEIRRLSEVERLSQRQIVRRLRCCGRTVKKAPTLEQPPDETHRAPCRSILDLYRSKIDALVARYPQQSVVRRRSPKTYGCLFAASLGAAFWDRRARPGYWASSSRTRSSVVASSSNSTEPSACTTHAPPW